MRTERVRGVNYLTDVRPKENTYHHWPSSHKEHWEEAERKANRNLDFGSLKQEMRFAKEQLHISAIRIAGHSIEESMSHAHAATEEQLTPWLSPRFHNATFTETRQMLAQYVERGVAEGVDSNPLIVANELPYDCIDDPVTGKKSNQPTADRIHYVTHEYLAKGTRIDSTERVKTLMQDTRDRGWKGPLVYAALPDEYVDWNQIPDQNVIVGVNLYWGTNYDEGRRMTSEEYGEKLQHAKDEAKGRPFILTEFGSVPQIDGSAGDGYQPTGDLDYAAQAQAYQQYLAVLENANVGYFAFTFDEPEKEYQKREHQSYALTTRGDDNMPQLTPAGEVFAEHNKHSERTAGTIVQ